MKYGREIQHLVRIPHCSQYIVALHSLQASQSLALALMYRDITVIVLKSKDIVTWYRMAVFTYQVFGYGILVEQQRPFLVQAEQ